MNGICLAMKAKNLMNMVLLVEEEEEGTWTLSFVRSWIAEVNLN